MELKILVVDDEMPTLKGLYRVLNKWSQGRYEILTAENGEEAIERIEKYGDSIMLILSDIRMPRRDGLSLLQWLRQRNLSIMTILFTGHAEFEYAREALRNGAANYLLKPVSEESLIEEVELALVRVEQKRMDLKKISLADQHPELLQQDDPIRNSFIVKAVEFITDQLSTPLTAMRVAEAVHLNSSYFSVLFKEEIGSTFTDYLIKVRLKKAKELLLRTDMKIYEIAEQIGYQTPSHFVKVFQEQEGLTPKKYREMYK
jgi:YesN/AraC family two-component response regulator